MTGVEVLRDHWQQSQDLDDDQNDQERFFLDQARIGLRADLNKRLMLNVGVDFRTKESGAFDRNEFNTSVTNAYVNFKAVRAVQFRVGRFKRPFSRIALRSSGSIPVRGRGLFEEDLLSGREWGGRSLGLMGWGRLKPLKLKWYAGLFNPVGRFRDDARKGVDALARVALSPMKGLSLGVNGGHKITQNNALETTHVNGFGGDVRIKAAGLYLALEADAVQDYAPEAIPAAPEERTPFGLGLIGYANYDIPLNRELTLQPVVFGEYFDRDTEYEEDEAVRAVFGLNLLVIEDVRIMPQVELIRPLGNVGVRSQVKQETYYVMVTAEI